MIHKRRLLGALLTAAAFTTAACSSSSDPGTPPDSTSHVEKPSASSSVLEYTPPPPGTPQAGPIWQEDPSAGAAREWMLSGPHRLRVELMIATAAQVKKQHGSSSLACQNLVNAVYSLDDQLPHIGTTAHGDPLIQQLINAASKFGLAGNACGVGVSSSVKRNLEAGFVAVRAAEKRAKKLHIHL